jgi:hypothetical protein
MENPKHKVCTLIFPSAYDVFQLLKLNDDKTQVLILEGFNIYARQ